jgi:hypothetical protein
MTTYNQLEKEFNEKVKKLQATCKHKHLTPWMEVCYAPGHYTGDAVRVCKDCNKRVHTQKGIYSDE